MQNRILCHFDMVVLPREYTRLILGLRPANERQHYLVAMSLIGWDQVLNKPWYNSYNNIYLELVGEI